MADNIELIKSPPTIALLDDGLRYQVESKLDFSGDSAEIILQLSSTQGNYLDNSFTLEFMGQEITFTFKASPDQSGIQLSTWDIADSYEVFATNLADELNAHFELNQYFMVSIAFHTPYYRLYIQAKNEGSLYDISLTDTDITGLSIYSETAGVDNSMPDDYRIFFALYKYAADPIPLDPLGMEKVAIDDDQVAEVNLAQYIDSELITQFTFPFNGVIQRDVSDAIQKYFIKYAEFKDDDVQLLRSNFDSPLYVVRGGLQRVDSDFFYDAEGNFFDYGDNLERFLNWAPTNKITYPDVPERLYFLKSTSGNLTVKLNVKKTDTAAAESDIATITAAQYSIIELAVGLPEIYPGLDVSDVEWYEIWIENASAEAVSEVRTFTVDQKTYLNKRILFFKNSFDVYETICCTGDLKVDDKFKREEVEVLQGPVFRRKINEVYKSQLYSLSSGWLDGQESRNWLTEVLLSKDTFYALGDFLLPVLIDNGKVNKSEDREHMYSITFQFEADFNESRYSSIVGDGAYFLLDEDGIILLDEDGIGLLDE